MKGRAISGAASGASSWGGSWLAAVTPGDAGATRETARGAAMARRGNVTDLRVRPGRVDARVTEDRVAPCEVRLRWPVPSEAVWADAVARLAGEVRFTAALLEGELPEGIDEVLAEQGVRLLPGPSELSTRCSCHARHPWCRHVAAVHHALAVLFDRDPFQLLWLRGRDHAALLIGLRAGRGVADAGVPDLRYGLYGVRGDLAQIPLSPAPPEDPSALLRHLGPPPGLDDLTPLAALVERAAETAWKLAAGAGSEAAEEELLLAELRGLRTATAAALADAVGRDVAAVRAALDTLFEAGAVLRTGAGERARYRAADT